MTAMTTITTARRASDKEIIEKAKAMGYEGRPGGWVYSRSGCAIAHGWDAFCGRVRGKTVLHWRELGWVITSKDTAFVGEPNID